MSAEGSVYSWCGCRDPATGNRRGSRCPRRGQRGHGSWYLSLELSAGLDGRRRRIRRGGLPPVRPHDLRHGAATVALAAKVDLKVVQDMLATPASC